MKLTIREYTADSLDFRFRTGPIWKPCNNAIHAKEAWKYVKPMCELLYRAGGIGLAANQVGLDIPLFVLRFSDKMQAVYRPRILQKSSKLVEGQEGCLSFPGALMPIYRHQEITVDFIAFPNNKRLKMTLWGLMARAFQHEMDHLAGKTLFHHYVVPIQPLANSEEVKVEEPVTALILD